MAIFFANLIMSEIEKNRHGVMAAYRGGEFIVTGIPGKNYAARSVNPADYQLAQYRPNYERISGEHLPRPGPKKG